MDQFTIDLGSHRRFNGRVPYISQNARLLALQNEQSDNLSPMDRLTAKADRVAESRTNLEKIVEAAKPLYESLGDEQKHKFITLGRMLVPERGSFAKEMRRLR